MERAADIYSTVEGFGTSKGKVSGSIQKADYMSVYTSDLVEAVRKAAGNIGISELFHQSKKIFWRSASWFDSCECKFEGPEIASLCPVPKHF